MTAIYKLNWLRCEKIISMLQNYNDLGCNMSLRTHFLRSHFALETWVLQVSDEHGERFHQDLAAMEMRY